MEIADARGESVLSAATGMSFSLRQELQREMRRESAPAAKGLRSVVCGYLSASV